MRAIADNPILSAASSNAAIADVFRPEETVELIPAELTNDEIFQLWQVLPSSSAALRPVRRPRRPARIDDRRTGRRAGAHPRTADAERIMNTPLEITGYRAPLAVSCADSATGAAVGDGLQVTALARARPGDVRTARRSPVSALLGFADLPGLRAYENAVAAAGGPLSWTAGARPAVPRSRSPIRCGDICPSSPRSASRSRLRCRSRLYSAPARPAPPGWATVRGSVHAQGGAPRRVGARYRRHRRRSYLGGPTSRGGS